MRFLYTSLIVLLCLCGVFSTAQSQVNLASGLVAYYPMSGNFQDASGNGHHGTGMNGVSFGADYLGNPGSAAFFDGINDFVSIAATPALTPGHQFSMAFRFKTNATTQQMIISKSIYNNATNFQYQAGINNPNLPNNKFYFCSNHKFGCGAPNNFGSDYTYGNFPVVNQWHCIVCTFDNGVKKVYMDGALIGTTTLTAPTFPNPTAIDSCLPGTIRLGTWWQGDPYWYSGLIDEVRLWNRALNVQEADALCNPSLQPPTGCFNIINLPDTLSSCKNAPVQLNPAVSGLGSLVTTDTTWTPATGLSNPNIINPIATVGPAGQKYKLTVTGLSPLSLVNNGDFSNGNTGFSSGYTYAGATMTSQGQYTITSNPNLVHPPYSSFPDHTGNPGGLMLVADGHTTPNVPVWCQTVTVLPNTLYSISAWAASAYPQNPSTIQFTVDGVPVAAPTSLTTTPGQWVNINNTWMSGSNTSVTLCFREASAVVQGNDFAIDDIQMRFYCQAVDSVFIKPVQLSTSIGLVSRPGCTTDTAQFSAINSGDVPTAYEWSFGDNTPTDTAKNPVHIYTQQGSFAIRLITTKAGCSDTAFTTATFVHPLDASFTVDQDSICLGTPIQFSSTGIATANPATHAWYFGNGAGSNTANVSYTYPAGGTYTVTYVLKDAVACRDTAQATIWVFEPHKSKIYLDDSVLCEGESIRASADSSYLPLGRAWATGDGHFYIDSTRLTHAYDTSGTYTLRLVETFNVCPADSIDRLITVAPAPLVRLGPDTFLCVNGAPIPLETDAALSQTGLRYRWNTGDTGKIRIMARNYGTYWLEATNAAGCSAADTVHVFKDCYIDIPNAFTPDGDGLNDYFFPRALLGRTITGFHMQIYNRWGQMIFESRRTDGRGWDGRFNNVMQPQGVFVYVIEAELDGKIKEKYTGNVTLLR